MVPYILVGMYAAFETEKLRRAILSGAGALVGCRFSSNSIVAAFQAKFIFSVVLPQFRCTGEPRDIGSNRARKSFEAGSTIHLALEGLQQIDVPLYRTVAPTFSERVVHRGQIVI